MAAKAETIREMWQGYRREAMPAVCSPTQIIETRRAFYGGVWAYFTRLTSNVCNDMSDVEAIAYYKSIEAESIRFRESVGTPLEGRE